MKRLFLFVTVLLFGMIFVGCSKKTDFKKIFEEANLMTFAEGDTKDTVKKDITLAGTSKVVTTATFNWDSNDKTMINIENNIGKVTRGNENKDITLKLTVTVGKESDFKEFKVTVLKKEEVVVETYHVTFDTDGGNSIPLQEVEKGKKVNKPTDPTKEGYDFKGWYLGEVAFDFDTEVTTALTLKAKWEAKAEEKFNVTFDTDGGNSIPLQEVEKGKKVNKPTDPTKEGYDFKGWYLGEVAFDFNTPVTTTLTLKAKWEKKEKKIIKENKDFQYLIIDYEIIIINYIGTAAEVTIPKEIDGVLVTIIGEGAFINCSNITHITLPNSIVKIEELAFYACSSLISVIIPDSVTTIGNAAFSNCFNLASIIIPNSVINIGFEAFKWCSKLKTYAEASERPSDWNWWWNYHSLPVSWGVSPKNVREYNNFQYLINNNNITITRYIGTAAEVTIPSEIDGIKVTSIGAYAFFGCHNLRNISIPSNVTSIENSAFSNCDSLIIYTEVNVEPLEWERGWNPNEQPIYWGVSFKDIKEYNDFQYLIINYEITIIKYTGISSTINIPKEIDKIPVTSIGRYAFSKCGNLKSITIPSNIICIGEYAFDWCSNLVIYAEVNEEPLEWEWYPDEQPIYWGVSSKDIKEYNDFQYLIINYEIIITRYTGISSTVNIPKEIDEIPVTSIGQYAFLNCGNLKSITIPSNVICIGEYTFNWCSNLVIYAEVNEEPLEWEWGWNLKELPIYWGVPSEYVKEYADFQYLIINYEIIITRYTGISSTVNIPKEIDEIPVTSIGQYAFLNCGNLKSITIPSSITAIRKYAFSNCNSLNIYAEARARPSEWNGHWNDDSNPVFWGVFSKEIKEYEGFQYLIIDHEITIIRYIGTALFVMIPKEIEGTRVTTVGSYAFSNCTDVISITIPNSVTNIGKNVFFNCRNLKSITIPSSVTTINEYAFPNYGRLIIYAEVSEESSKWNLNSLNPNQITVYWGTFLEKQNKNSKNF